MQTPSQLSTALSVSISTQSCFFIHPPPLLFQLSLCQRAFVRICKNLIQTSVPENLAKRVILP